MDQPWAAFRYGRVVYLGLHPNEEDCWRIFLGWPDDEEINQAKKRGYTCKRVSVVIDPPTPA